MWAIVVAALSSRGLGRGPLKAQTRVRIPLALCDEDAIGPIVYRLGRHPFTVQRGVRFPLGLLGGLAVNQSGVTRQVSSEEGVSDPDSSSWGRSSVWLEHSTVTREVAGSSPVGPVLFFLNEFGFAVNCGLRTQVLPWW